MASHFLHVPADFAITHPCFSAQGQSVVTGVSGTFSFTVRRTCTEISVEDYPSYRDRVRDTAAKLRDAISFVKKKPRR